jgi:hypothetical protein
MKLGWVPDISQTNRRCPHKARYVLTCTYNGLMRCYRCKEDRPEEEFHRNASKPRGRSDYCRDCKNGARRGRSPEAKRKERLAWRAKNREKYRAQKALQKAVAAGRIVRPESCERCDEGPVQGHHPDYDKRLEVVWLCPRCHGEEHAGWTWPDAA